MTAEPLKTVSDVLERLDTSFAEFSSAFDAGEYVLWLGSGISRARVPNVGTLVERVLEHLRSNITDDTGCVYRTALEEVLRLASLTGEEMSSLNFTELVEGWPLRERIATALVTKYSHVLDVQVGDENPADYLVWTGLDVPNTYGSPALVPDVEHYAIAILMLEGLVTSAVTANWDGLLEKALAELTPAFDSLVRVVVKPDDFRINGPRMEVIKFHGCAVLARENEDAYRPLLIAREEQISGWTAQQANSSMRKHLEVLYTDRPTLMIGLSAQDANLHTVFATAIQDLARPWPAAPPAVVYSEEHLESYHRVVLKLTYGSSYQGNSTAIAQSALLGSYGKPTLLALVLSSLTDKLSFLVEHALGSTWNAADVKRLREDLVGLRGLAATLADPANRDDLDDSEIAEFQRKFVARVIDVTHLAITVFRTGQVRLVGGPQYEPLSTTPADQAVHNPDFPAEAFGLLGAALSMVGRGRTDGHWSVVPGDSKAPNKGVLRLVAGEHEARVFFVKDSAALTRLELDGSFDRSDGQAFVVVTEEEPLESTRSPRGRYGRDGKATAGRFSVAKAAAETGSADGLYEAFKLAGGF